MAKLVLLTLMVMVTFQAVVAVASYDWRAWYSSRQESENVKQQRLRQQQQQQQHQRQQHAEQSALTRRLEEARRQELLQERQEGLQEEMEDLIADNELEELALQMGTQALVRILRPLREQPTQMPIADCVDSAPYNVNLERYAVSGAFIYTVCGDGDRSTLRMRFQLPGQTTPTAESTTTEPPPTCPTVTCPPTVTCTQCPVVTPCPTTPVATTTPVAITTPVATTTPLATTTPVATTTPPVTSTPVATSPPVATSTPVATTTPSLTTPT